MLIAITNDFHSPRLISVPNIACLLKTSKYQVRKYINNLREDGLCTSDTCIIKDEYENFPPYKGFRLTSKGRQTDAFKKAELEYEKLMRDCFNC